MNDTGTLTITAGSDDQQVFIDIGDTGPGIAPENVTRVFDPFFTTKAERGGTGLGLSIAQRIISAQSGTLTVLSTAPAGSTFRITLPRTTP
jgi:signal transduction histidine kinase